MTIRLLLFAILMILNTSVYCQQKISGTIIDAQTENKISFASVGLLFSNSGVTANEDGYFSIYSTKSFDTLIISCVGYLEKRMATNLLSETNVFKLTITTPKLQPVFVNSTPLKISVLNKYSNCGNDSYTTSGTVIQIAQLYQFQTPKFKLKKIELCKWRGNAIFRIRIYGLDSISGKPGADLTDSIIEINSTAKKIVLDISKYNIWITGGKFYLAVEWLEIPFNSNNSKSNFQSLKLYHPFLSIAKNDDADCSDNSNLWYLSYRRVWQKLDTSICRFLISVDIGY